jgi:hypothetical protein
MALFHRHNWTEVRRYFVPPANRRVRLGGARGREAIIETEQMMHDFANGYTVVELRCEDCGDVTSRRLPGDAT